MKILISYWFEVKLNHTEEIKNNILDTIDTITRNQIEKILERETIRRLFRGLHVNDEDCKKLMKIKTSALIL